MRNSSPRSRPPAAAAVRQRGGGAAIREILVPTDLASDSDPALEHAAVLAGVFGATLTLYHAVEVPDPSHAHWAFAHGHEIWRVAEAHALAALERRSAGLQVPARAVVERAASPGQAVVAFVKATRPDLTVMATHGRGALGHMLLGSVTERVIEQTQRPVLCVRHGDAARHALYRRVLVPTDFSPASRYAFPLAARIAAAFGAEILALHVVPPASVATLSGIPAPQVVAVPSEAALWKFFQQDFAELEVTAQVHSGTAWERIVEAARAEQADLIVMSTRGHDSLADRILGSNTERVVRHAACPVLVA